MVNNNKISIVIATKDRPEELARLLTNLSCISSPPDEIVVVDGGENSVKSVLEQYSCLHFCYRIERPPSASRQRNVGIRSVDPDSKFIGFFDDDIILDNDAMLNMRKYWKNAAKKIGGAAFNLMNHPDQFASKLKRLPIIEQLGLYGRDIGKVLPSGFHTRIGQVVNDTEVQWLPSGAVIFRREIFEAISFDEWFKGYSYLEDLDFSYRANKICKLIIVSDAKYFHFPGYSGRGNGMEFGKREIFNRLYFVKKNRELSLVKCYQALFLRVLINLFQSVKMRRIELFERVWGNLLGIVGSIIVR